MRSLRTRRADLFRTIRNFTCSAAGFNDAANEKMVYLNLNRHQTLPKLPREATEGKKRLEIKNLRRRLLLSCSSCGVALQTEDSAYPGFYVNPGSKENKIRVAENDKMKLLNTDWYAEKLKELEETLEDERLNDFAKFKKENDLSEETEPNFPETIPSVKSRKLKRLHCQRCKNALHHSVYDEAQHQTYPIDELLDQVPADATVVYVASSLDFPLSINRKVFEKIDRKRMFFAITKADCFYSDPKGPHRTGATYFRDSMQRLYGVDPERVFLLSGKRGWNTKYLVQKMPRGSVYFIGEVNSGKSTLIKELVYNDNLDLKPNSDFGPGISPLPSFTRSPMEYDLSKGTTIVDMPGYTPEEKGMYKYVLSDHIQQVFSEPVMVNEFKVLKGTATPWIPLKPKNFNGKRVLSVAGFFYLKPPADAVIKIKSGIPGKAHTFSSIDSAITTCHERADGIKPYFYTTIDSAEDLVRYVIPPFYANVDLVISGLGYVRIKPTGKRETKGLFEVYVPKNVKVIAREPIYKFLYRSKGFADSSGNKVLKKNIVSKGQTELKRVPHDKPIFTRLVPVPMGATQKEAWDSILKGTAPKELDVMESEYENQEEYPNTFWNDDI